MRVVSINLTTPYKENFRGTTALPYHLLKERSDGVDVVIYTFNANRLTIAQMAEVERELGVEIRLLQLPRWYRWMFKLHLLWLRVFLRYPFVNYITLPQRVVEEIKAQEPDMIWVNGEELSRIVEQFPGMRRMQIGPDVESLYYYRMMGRRFVMNNVVDYWKCAMMYRKYAQLERSFCTDDNFTYYAVGEADIEHLRQLNPRVHCEFLRHPHYEVAEQGPIRFHRPKIRLLIAGQYNLYMQQTADEVVQFIMHNAQCIMHNEGSDSLQSPQETLSPQETQSPQAPLEEPSSPPKSPLKRGTSCSGSKTELPPLQGGLGGASDQVVHAARRVPTMPLVTPPSSGGDGGGLSHYTITFLGKGWERHVEALRSMGIEVNHIKFAPDYIEEVIKHDIQVTPITIGTGTKGKVLDALANGLLVLGTPYAMENIAVEHGTSCMVWRTPQELLQVLQDIPQRIEHYEQMAEAGRQAVLERHSRHQIAEELFG